LRDEVRSLRGRIERLRARAEELRRRPPPKQGGNARYEIVFWRVLLAALQVIGALSIFAGVVAAAALLR
jgi:hypothetical protein